ncbi:MAG: hypothetical protein OSB25_09685 [Salibacteraceae bacterium]|nr:hypothetical protein [Salibacteraceae bacterium]|tara:strand:+ start:74829 stop:75221 length:393 start_codon:yes stop_codon:yes gene_type:complete
MIKHSLIDNLVYISIDNVDFSYRIPIKKIGNSIDWRIGVKGTAGIVMKNVSTWTLQLFTKNITDNKYVNQFKSILEEHSTNNTIDWEDTLLAVIIQNEYNKLIAANNITAEKKNSEDEIISMLKKKYKLD